MSIEILAVTGTRADWGLLYPVVKRLRDDPDFDLRLAVTGQHLMEGSAKSLQIIEEQGFEIAHKVDLDITGDEQRDIAHALGQAVAGFGDLLSARKPDYMMVLGDRYEILGPVQAALIFGVPIIHLCGGDTTEGAIDEQIRHAITKMSHLHFATTREAEARVLQMGENPEYVYNVGSSGLDMVAEVPLMERVSLFKKIGFTARPKNLLITFHPVTLEEDSQAQCAEMLAALESLGPDYGLIFTGSNADAQGKKLTQMVKDFAGAHDNAVFHESLGSQLYIQALRQVEAVVGNSSSGLYEAPSFNIPTINIGERQSGRLKAESVLDCAPERAAIAETITRGLALDLSHIVNPYGDGKASERIIASIKKIEKPASLRVKRFHYVK